MESEAERSSGSAVSPGPFPLAAGPSAAVAALTACSPYFLDSALPSDSDHNYDHDHHSSEEELEVINSCPAAVAPGSSDSPPEAASSGCRLPGGGGGGGSCGPGGGARPASGAGALLVTVRSGSVTVPEKRKWSQVTHQAAPHVLLAADCPSGGGGGGSSSSSDDEVQGLLAAMSTPVRFRTWPPLDAHKPGRSLSPPPKLFHYAAAADAAAAPAPASGLAPAAAAASSASAAAADASPRKRHRHTPRASHIPRPCLDFEKMQQLKARAVTAWRHGGDRGGELSVFCW